jgi:excisionase family DNA binding protein
VTSGDGHATVEGNILLLSAASSAFDHLKCLTVSRLALKKLEKVPLAMLPGRVASDHPKMTQTKKTPNQILTVEDVAEYLKVHASTIYKLLKRREIRAFRVGADCGSKLLKSRSG